MVQGQMSASGAFDIYKNSALDCLKLCLVRRPEDVEKENEKFSPLFAHQLFGEDEIIFGYKELDVKLFYTAGSLRCYIKVQFANKLTQKSSDIKVDDHPVETLKDNFVNGFLSSEVEFLKEVQKDEAFVPPGTLLKEYHRENPGTKTRTFCLYKCNGDTPNFVEYHKNIQTFLTFFIDGASFIDTDDPDWLYYVLFEKYPQDGKTKFAFVGYATVYLFFSYPDGKRARISQFLILPPFSRQGHGSELLKSLYEDVSLMKHVKDVTVEDPAMDFICMRDVVDCQNVIRNFPAICLSPGKLARLTKKLALEGQEKLKINIKQFKRVYEILEYFYLNSTNKKELTAYKKMLRDRIRKSLKKPKTKLSSFELKLALEFDGLADEDGSRYTEAASLLEEEFQESQVDEILNNTLEHYITVVNKLSSLV